MATIRKAADLETWLKGKPSAVAAVLAARVALRVLPLVKTWQMESYSSGRDNLVFPAFRIAAASLAVARYPAYNLVLRPATAVMILTSTNVPAAPFEACHFAATAANRANTSARDDSLKSATAAAAAVVAATATATTRGAVLSVADASAGIWSSVELDAIRIDGGISPVKLAAIALWDPSGMARDIPPIIAEQWPALKSDLLATNEDWDIWTDWYDAILAGKHFSSRALDIFRVTLSDEATKVSAKDLRANDWKEALKDRDADWRRGPAHVNALIKAWIKDKLGPDKPLAAPDGPRVGLTQAANQFAGAEIPAGSQPQKPATAATASGKPKRPPKPKSRAAKAALANQLAIALQSEAIRHAIDDRIAVLERQPLLNDPDSIKAWATELEELRAWKQTATDLLVSLQSLLSTGDERKLAASAKALHDAVAKLLGERGIALALDTTRVVVLAGFASCLSLLGLNPMIDVTLTVGATAIMGGKLAIDGLKSVGAFRQEKAS